MTAPIPSRTLKSAVLSLSSLVVVAAVAPVSIAPRSVLAQDASGNGTLTTEGVSGTRDSSRRDPVLTVGTHRVGSTVKILADAFVPNSEFQQYPLRFEFFVNRQLISTQMRSVELPGPVGLDVLPSIAKPPFNYTVVAKVLHPNREYTTVLHGAVFASDVTTTFTGCTFTTNNNDTDLVLTSSEISSAQNGNDSLSVSFEANSEDKSRTSDVELTLTLNGENAAGTITADDDANLSNDSVSGTVTRSGDQISALSVETTDGSSSVVCQ